MTHRKLGRTGLMVSPLCLGGNTFGWTTDERRSCEVLDAYTESGGNFIDTADTYSAWIPGHVGGESETILGNWMSSRGNRDRVIIATKVGSKMGVAPVTGGLTQGLSRRYILDEAEASLRRLKTDYIDLYQAHRDDPNTPLDETLAAFDELVRQGKVRAIGASNYSAARLREALQISEQRHYVRYECLQPPYSLVNRAAYERELESLCLEQALGVMTYSSLASGFLTGKYRSGRNLPNTPRANGIQDRYMNERGFRILAQLDQVAEARHSTVSQVALAWVMTRPGVTSAIASATSIEQLRELFGAVELRLSDQERQQLDAASQE